ncbi:MAG: hypothetical protein OXH92_22245 [Bryobacterales bacterium]|nr:hypothetical protein [Bryobacterales bacterium]
MKTLRFLLLLGVGVMVAAVISDYIDTRETNLRIRVAEPDTIPSNLNTQSGRWSWSQSSGSERAIEITAGGLRQSNDSLVLDLEDVELRILHGDRGTYDLVETPAALFDTRKEQLYSEGEVSITLAIPSQSRQAGHVPTRIHTSGVTFESKTGICATERRAEYEFGGGRGHSTGAFYDPARRFFRMESDVFLERFGEDGRPPARVRAGTMIFREDSQIVDLNGAVSVERGSERLEAERAFVHLDQGRARWVDAREVKGSDHQGNRTVQYASRRLYVALTEDQMLDKVRATGAATLQSRSGSSRMRAWGDRIELYYETRPGSMESLLRRVNLRNQAQVEEHPAASRGIGLRRLQADSIELRMADNGEDLQTLSALTRGRLDLEPADETGVRRQLEADRIQGIYGEGNRLEYLKANGKVMVESIPGADEGNAEHPPLKTWSEAFESSFDPGTGEARLLKQWNGFGFQRGRRQGRAGEAVFDPAGNEIALSTDAHVWDLSGAIRADRILFDENTGDYEARGRASSSFTEASTETASREEANGFFAPGQPVFSSAEEITSLRDSGVLILNGQARLWQEQNRLEADMIRIDKPAKILRAEGNVVNYLTEPANGGRPAANDRPAVEQVRIRSASLDYDEEEKLMVYVGSAELRRADLTVTSDRLEGHLGSDEETGSRNRLEKAFATGNVRIVRRGASDARQGAGRNAEYYPRESKVILIGAPASVQDGRRGRTEGARLTYYLDDDRLLVQGSSQERARTLRRKAP